MSNIERDAKPIHLMVDAASGEPVRVVQADDVLAGLYEAVEYVPRAHLRGAVEAERERIVALVKAMRAEHGTGPTGQYGLGSRVALDEVLDALEGQ